MVYVSEEDNRKIGKCRNFVFTWHNYPVDWEQQLLNLRYQYLIAGVELCPSSSRWHIQGYVQMQVQTRFSLIHRTIQGLWIKEAKGDDSDNYEYCSKDGNYVEHGQRKRAGRRVDIEMAKEIASNKTSIRETLETVKTFNLQTINCIEKVYKYYERKRDFKPRVIWLYGKPGVGKTKLAHEILEENEKDIYVKDFNETGSKWFDGYDAHSGLILDDIRESNIGFITLIKLIDRYEFRVETKGGTRQMLADEIIITSLLPPNEEFKFHGENLEQLLRRIDFIFEVKEGMTFDDLEFVED